MSDEFDPLTADLLKQEHAQRNQELQDCISCIESEQRYGLLFTGAIWSWLAANPETIPLGSVFAQAALFIPAGLAVLFMFRWWCWGLSMGVRATYLKRIEESAGLVKHGLGFETWVKVQQDKTRNGEAADVRAGNPIKAPLTLWCSVVALNVLLAILFIIRRT